MKPYLHEQFLQYLKNDLAISDASIAYALKSVGKDFHLLPIALWKCDALTLAQVGHAYDWLAIANQSTSDISSNFSRNT